MSRDISDDAGKVLSLLVEIGIAMRGKKVGSGELPCPKCGGVVDWRSAGPRAIRAACRTPDCLRFLT
jgi:predicted RNA-binding Zn-ribbon protein involved in translation (DUF1610 family)